MPEQPNPADPEPDDFDRQLRELTSGTAGAARFTELSAAERASQAARPAPARKPANWRDARKARNLRRPVSGSSRGQARPGGRGPAGSAGMRRPEARQRGGKRSRSAAKITGVLVAFLALLYVLHLLGFGPQSAGSPVTGAAPRPSPTNSVTVSPGPRVTPAYTTADPFAGSPAERYQDGAAGIVLPAAHRVGAYSAARVAAAYAQTKRLLVAANLNPATLHGGRPDAFARLLVRPQRAHFLRDLGKTGVDRRGASLSTRGWVTSFSPGTAFVGSVIKVHGTMSATTATDNGWSVLRITFKYLFVYPVQRPGQPASRMRVVQTVLGSADFAQWTDPGGPLQPWWQLGPWLSAGAFCDSADGYVHPDFPGSAPRKVQPSGAPVDPYNLSNPPTRNYCQAITGT